MSVDPQTYATWRRTLLGSITEELEQRLVFDLAGPLAGRRVLDVGCGDGAYSVTAAERGGIVTGIDSSEDMLAAARHRAERVGHSVSFVTADAERLPFADRSFDVIFAITLLCFVKHPLRASPRSRGSWFLAEGSSSVTLGAAACGLHGAVCGASLGRRHGVRSGSARPGSFASWWRQRSFASSRSGAPSSIRPWAWPPAHSSASTRPSDGSRRGEPHSSRFLP